MICTLCLSFSAKQASRLRKSQIRTRELETHRNRSLCSHDLIRHGGAGLSGSGSACCTDGKSKSNLRRELGQSRELCGCRPELLGDEDASIRGSERRAPRCLCNLLRALNIKSHFLFSSPLGRRHVSSTAVPKYGLPLLLIWTSTSRREDINLRGNLAAQRELGEHTRATVRTEERDRETNTQPRNKTAKVTSSFKTSIQDGPPDWMGSLICCKKSKLIIWLILIHF